MKKLFTVLCAGLLMGVINAQSSFIAITPPQAIADMVTPPNTNVTGDTAQFANLSVVNTIQGAIYIINTSGSSKTVRCIRTAENTIPGSSNYFCWDLCYTPVVDTGGTMTIAAGDTAKIFYGDYEPNANAGVSYVTYQFWDESNQTDLISFTVQFTAGSIGIEEEAVTLSNVYPNPATNYITFNFSKPVENGTIQISDLTGKVVKTVKLNEHSAQQVVNVENLTNGIYIYTFYANGKSISTRKFIVKK